MPKMQKKQKKKYMCCYVPMLQVMMAAGGSNALGAPVISCYMNPEKRFAFVEFRSVEECSNAMALDGISCQVCGGKGHKVILGNQAGSGARGSVLHPTLIHRMLCSYASLLKEAYDASVKVCGPC
jgi:hypothetical protein